MPGIALSRDVLQCVHGRGRPGAQIAGGHPQALPRPRQPLFAVPAFERELESTWRGEHFVRCCHSAHSLSAFQGLCDPKPPRPFCSV